MINTQISAESIIEGSFESFEFGEAQGGGAAVITKVGGQIFAFSAKCPHAGGDFREGELHRGRVFCPVHQWKFDLKSGRCIGDENYRLKKYEVSMINGLIHLKTK